MGIISLPVGGNKEKQRMTPNDEQGVNFFWVGYAKFYTHFFFFYVVRRKEGGKGS